VLRGLPWQRERRQIESQNRGTVLGKGETLQNSLRRCTDSYSSLRGYPPSRKGDGLPFFTCRSHCTITPDVDVFVGNSAFPLLATAGGLVEHLVKLNDNVEPGQKVAIQRNSFGDVVAEYTSGVAGKIAGQRSDAMSEPGNPLVFILFNKATREGVEAYPE
jgi:hypothetical protein